VRSTALGATRQICQQYTSPNHVQSRPAPLEFSISRTSIQQIRQTNSFWYREEIEKCRNVIANLFRGVRGRIMWHVGLAIAQHVGNNHSEALSTPWANLVPPSEPDNTSSWNIHIENFHEYHESGKPCKQISGGRVAS